MEFKNENIAKIYLTLINQGLKTIDDVPPKLKELVWELQKQEIFNKD